ncbi:hypothetical protein NLG97_g3972 [Lecanicillium saksenae]|uniref:Uncharacterized protein n=1 Tax=Lecanicillium saksenae TaxID=468837 RepID=A0ACC1QZ73_9HYPO|nr:hypothetical protein NLG97_g3972 [Lecanicillium saksenae]
MVPFEDPIFLGLRTQYYRYLVKHLATVNKLMNSNLAVENSLAIHSLYVLSSLDANMSGHLWHKHMQGAFAYVQHLGGVKGVQNLPNGLHRFRLLLCRAIFGNTLSPATNQMLGYACYTDDELQIALRDQEVSGDTPCPVDMLMCMIQISRLRTQLAYRVTEKPTLLAEVQQTFDAINGFDLQAWAAERNLSDKGITLSLGEVYVVAVRLYGYLTLPHTRLTNRTANQHHTRVMGGLDSGHGRCEAETRRLMKLLRHLWSNITYKPALMWPLLVAGVGLSTGTAEDRQFVDNCVVSIWQSPIIECNSIQGLEKLRIFWAGGYTAWDDCFNEPSMC